MELDEYLSLEADFASAFALCKDETMTSPERLFAVWQAVEYLCKSGVQGDIVECGVWRGGSSMMAALALQHFGDASRKLWLYDTFEGMPPAEDIDVMAINGAKAQEVLADQPRQEDNPYWAIAGLDAVRGNMDRVNYPSEKVEYVVGKVEDTIPSAVPEKISLLRLDTDWHSSTLHELVHLWPRLVHGGVIIIDDYGFWEGARRAVEGYFDGRDDRPLLARIDVTGRMAVKL